MYIYTAMYVWMSAYVWLKYTNSLNIMETHKNRSSFISESVTNKKKTKKAHTNKQVYVHLGIHTYVYTYIQEHI